MSLPERITTLLASLTPNQVSGLPPAERQQLANECQRVLALASAKPATFRCGAGEHAQAGAEIKGERAL